MGMVFFLSTLNLMLSQMCFISLEGVKKKKISNEYYMSLTEYLLFVRIIKCENVPIPRRVVEHPTFLTL